MSRKLASSKLHDSFLTARKMRKSGKGMSIAEDTPRQRMRKKMHRGMTGHAVPFGNMKFMRLSLFPACTALENDKVQHLELVKTW
uniref:Uncharacterized protein n=1 Tax=Tetraselmis sp. GSL018 TaxID=582737 RepID=A0A061RSE3_9CHLO